MKWTASLSSLKAFHVSQDQTTSVFLYTSQSSYGSKVIVKQIACPSQAFAQHAEFEAKVAIAHPHPRITECLGCVKEPNPAGGFFVYIFFPALPKSLIDDVSEKAKQADFYSEQELWSFYEQLLDAFVYLQGLGVAHRDIKPHNVLLTDQRQLKICDFGFAKQIGSQGPAVSSLLGTMSYFSPLLRAAYLRGGVTQVQHNAFKSDVYSLGMMLLHLTLLDLPQKLRELPNLQQNLDTELNRLRPRYSEKWVELLRCMLKVEEDSRPDFLGLQARQQVATLIADDEYVEPLQGGVEMQEGLQLTIKSGLPQVRVSAQESDEVPCLITLQGLSPSLEPAPQGTDIVCVLDQSGSMSGRTLQMMHSALVGVVERLGERDRMAFICHSSNAEQRCPLIRGSAEGKVKLREYAQKYAIMCNTNLAKGFLSGLEVLKQRRYSNTSACIMLFSDAKMNKDDDVTPCLTAFHESRLNRVRVSGIHYSNHLDCRSFVSLVSGTHGELLSLTSSDSTPQVYDFALGKSSSCIAKELRISINVQQTGKVPCEVTKVYSEDGSTTISLPELSVGQEKHFVFLLKPRLRDLASAVRCKTVEVELSFKDEEDTDSFKSETLDMKFVKGGVAMAPQDDVVYSHWHRVKREYSSARCLILADELLSGCMEQLQLRDFRGMSTVERVVEELRRARELIQSHSSWQQELPESTYTSSTTSSYRT